MKNRIYLLLFFIFNLLAGCQSVEKYNAHADKNIAIEKLKKDVDYVQKKLNKNHAKLDLYLSKDKINFKFDSFKKTIDKPLLPNDFYVKFFPILGSVKHGHTDLFPYSKKLSSKEKKRIKNTRGPLNQMHLFWQNDSVYLVRSSVKDTLLKSGSVLQSIDNVSPYALREKYTNAFYGDGYNRTFADNRLNRNFLEYYYTLENGYKDSMNFVFNYKGKEYSKVVHRLIESKKKVDLNSKKTPANTPVKEESSKSAKFTIKPFEFDYNKSTKTYGKILSFPTHDSAFAVLKVNNFRHGNFQKSYKGVFTLIRDYKVKNLVIDLRNNGGGKLADSYLLYSYLVGNGKPYLGDQIVQSSSAMQSTMVDMMPWYAKPFVYPVSMISYFLTKKNKNGETLIKPSLNKVKRAPDDLIYNGNLYVLINGGSYSASALISSNLKGENRAFFVGEETGGDATGTVAGFMPSYQLPHSKLRFTIGTIYLQPTHANLFKKGHGIIPDHEIKPRLQDKIRNIDPELIWVLTDIKNGNQELKKVIQSSQKSVELH